MQKTGRIGARHAVPRLSHSLLSRSTGFSPVLRSFSRCWHDICTLWKPDRPPAPHLFQAECTGGSGPTMDQSLYTSNDLLIQRTQKLSLNQIQAVRVLQYPGQELQAYLANALAENPALEGEEW